MQIETYEIEEIKDSEASTMAADAEAMELIEKLELDGQKSLSNPETLTRFPYPRLTSKQEAVFTAMFPEQSNARSYNAGIIPLRVLQVIAYCQTCPQTKYLQIWHTRIPKEDPILIGSPTQYSNEKYLLARWGDALPTFEELTAKALPMVKAKFAAEIEKGLAKLSSYKAAVNELSAQFLEDGSRPTWSIYD